MLHTDALAAAPRRGRAGILELPARRLLQRPRRGARDLPHEPPPGAATSRSSTASPSTRPTAIAAPAAAADRLRASHLHASDSLRRAAAAAGLNGHRNTVLLRRVPRLGLPRGRLRCRGCAPRWHWGAHGDRAPRSTRATSCTTRRPGDAQRVPPRRLHVAGRPRRARPARRLPWLFGTTGRVDRDPQPRPSGRPRPHDQQNLDGYLAANGVDLDGGRVHALDQRARAGLRLQPTLGVLVPRAGRQAAVRRRGGAQHLRRTPLLPARTRATAAAARPTRQFYVSPFLTVDGRYRMSLRRPASGSRADGAGPGRRRVFAASLTGRRRPLTAAQPGADAAAPSLMPAQVTRADPPARRAPAGRGVRRVPRPPRSPGARGMSTRADPRRRGPQSRRRARRVAVRPSPGPVHRAVEGPLRGDLARRTR